MTTIFFALATFLMAATGIYRNWTLDNADTGDPLGARCLPLVALPAISAVFVALALPDQAHIAAIGFAVWGFITLVGAAVMCQVRKDKTSDWYRTYTMQQGLWLGIGLAAGAAAIGMMINMGVAH